MDILPKAEAKTTPSKGPSQGSTIQAIEKAFPNAKGKGKGKGKSLGDNLPATPEKSKDEAKGCPAEEPSKAEEQFEAVKGAWATIKGESLSEIRWATKADEQEDTAPTPKSEAESSPFGGSRGRNKVRDVAI